MPYPRGEFCIKRSRMINEYFNDPEATKNGFDEEGYFHTGDIVELLEIRKIRVIDRSDNNKKKVVIEDDIADLVRCLKKKKKQKEELFQGVSGRVCDA